MPIYHNVMLRYQALDTCFSDRGKYYFIENLLDSVNKLLANNCEPPVSKRTIQYDIQKMESNHDWVVVFEEPALKGGRRYYRYADTEYSIFRRDLSQGQLSELKSTLLLLNQFRGLPQFNRVKELISDLEKQYDFTEYFDNVIGMTNTQDKPERVVLRFTEKRLPYVLSKPLHRETGC